MFLGGEQVLEDFLWLEIRALAEIGEGFGGGEGAALATAEMIAGEERAAGAGEHFGDAAHGQAGVNLV